MRRATCAAIILVAALLTGCGATEAEVRDACLEHGGVNAVSGNKIRKSVACKDGHYRIVR
jgi:hypothetical protein